MEKKNPGQLRSYFWMEKKNLCIVSITGLVYNVGMTAGPYFEGRLAQCLYDVMERKKTWMDMMVLVFAYVLVIFFVQGSRAGKRFYVRRFANNTSKNMRSNLYHSIIHTEKRDLEQEQLGTIMTKAISDVDACVEGMRKFTTEIFDTGIVLLAYAVMLCLYDVRLAVISCLLIPAAYLIAQKCKGIVTRYNEIYKKSAGTLNQTTLDLVGNALTYRVFGLESKRREVYEKNLARYEKNAVRANLWESALQPIYHVIAMGGAVFIFYLGGKNVLGTGFVSWDIGAFTTFFSCFTKLALKSSKAAKLFNAVQKAEVSWKRIQPMFSNCQEKETEDSNQTENRKETEILCFHKVGISYSKSDNLQSALSFSAKKGQIIGITGGIASGKTAIGKVFIDEANYEGDILMDGNAFHEFTKEEKKERIAYMGHEPELMSGSILENVLLGKDADSFREDREKTVWNYLRLVCLEEEVKKMPKGLYTMVGTGGIRLSGGQQARLALARSLCHKKSLLLLDDPFSAVDPKTEKKIFSQISPVCKDGITLFISHRLSLFPQFDGVLFLHDKTASFGSHEKLMREEPEYRKLFCMQDGVPSREEKGENEDA